MKTQKQALLHLYNCEQKIALSLALKKNRKKTMVT